VVIADPMLAAMRRCIPLLAVVMTALFVLGTPAAHAAPANAAIGISTKPVITSWGVRYAFVHSGGKATVVGSIRPARKVTLVLQSSRDGKSWKALVRKATDAKGNVSYVFAPTASLRYRWVFAGDSAVKAATSPQVIVRVYPKPVRYKSCAAMWKHYPNGVGLPNAKDSTRNTPNRNFLPSAAVYKLNNWAPRGNKADRDRDDDGIACEP